MKRVDEPNEEYFLNCMDPGGDTGLALLHITPTQYSLVAHATIPWRPDRGSNPVDTLTGWLDEFPGTHKLVYEAFHIRNTASAASTDTTALSVIEAVSGLARTRQPYEEMVSKQPVAAKRFATDAVLESLGLHLGHKHAQRHIRDALRHGVTLLARRRYIPLCAAAFPRGGVRTPRPLSTGSRR